MKVIYLDVETTGLNEYVHAVIQVAWIVEISGVVVSEQSLLVRPFDGAEIDPGAMKTHGITVAELFEYGVSQQSAAAQIAEDWGRFIDASDGNDLAALCAYNLQKDFGFLQRMFERIGAPHLGRWIQVGRWLDPFYLAAFAQHLGAMDRTSDMRLKTVAEALGIETGRSHNAIDDIRTTRRVMSVLSVLSVLSEQRGSYAGVA